MQDIVDKVGEKGLKEILQVCAEEGIPIRDAGPLKVEEVPASIVDTESEEDSGEDSSLDSALSRLSNM